MITMLIQRVATGEVVATLEYPDGCTEKQVFYSWLGSQGLTPACTEFKTNLCPVTPWIELRTVWIAYCDQRWRVKGTNTVCDGYEYRAMFGKSPEERRKMGLPEKIEWEYLGPEYKPE